MNRRVSKPKPHAPEKAVSGGRRRIDGTTSKTQNPPTVPRRGIVKRKVVSRKLLENDPKKTTVSGKQSWPKTCHASSTPLSTPLKAEKLQHPGKDAGLDSLSDISKSSSKSSVCSSVSSGLIELLCNYNNESLKAEKLRENIPEKEAVDKDETLKNEATFSFVIPTEEPNCDGRIKILSGLLGKLKTTVGSIISSGDSKSVKRMEKLVDTMEKQFEGLQNELPALWVQKREFETEIATATAPLRTENAALQRKIRILNQNLAEKERRSNEKDLSLELETVQCMNNSLMEQVKKLSSFLQQVQGEKLKQEEEIADLKRDGKRLNEDLLHKNAEFTKSQEIFSSEAGTIKNEVANALQKIDALKHQLYEADTESELMKVSLQEKDEEIARLNDLNKGLQSSVSRLLEDLKRASSRPQRAAPATEVSSAILKNLHSVLNGPQYVAPAPQKSQPLWGEPFPPQRFPNSFTKSYPPLSGKENYMQCPYPDRTPTGGSTDLYTDDEFLSPNNFDNVLESSRLSTLRSDVPTSSMASLSLSEQRCYGYLHKGSSVTTSTKPMPWEQSSVSSSFVSFSTRDENDFANGLALLDADMQRLQESLHDMSAKKS